MLSPPQLHLAEKKNYEVVDSVIEVLQRKPSHKPWQSVNINFMQSKQELSAYTAFGKPPKKNSSRLIQQTANIFGKICRIKPLYVSKFFLSSG